jgi:hypothetical protein
MYLGLSPVNERLIAKTLTIAVVIWQARCRSYEEILRGIKALSIFKKTNTTEK